MQIKFTEKLKAMTFAEAAITMLIMGVVFAITVPGLKKYTQRSEMQTLLKKSYGTINQTIDRALADSNDLIPERMEEWDFSSNDVFMDRYLRPFLSVAKECSTSDYDCFSNYYRNLDGSGNTNIAAFASSVLLNDGTAVQIHGCNGSQCDVHVDLNGPTEPNVMGMDYWEFTIHKNTAQVKPNDEGGDYSTQDIFENNWKITKW